MIKIIAKSKYTQDMRLYIKQNKRQIKSTLKSNLIKKIGKSTYRNENKDLHFFCFKKAFLVSLQDEYEEHNKRILRNGKGHTKEHEEHTRV